MADGVTDEEPSLAEEFVSCARHGELEALREALREQPELVESRDSSGNTGLHTAAANGHVDVVRLLLECASSRAGDDRQRIVSFVNSQNESGNTALHWAALNGQRPAVKVLLGAGADPTLVNGAGNTPLSESKNAGRYSTSAVLEKFMPEEPSSSAPPPSVVVEEDVEDDEDDDDQAEPRPNETE